MKTSYIFGAAIAAGAIASLVDLAEAATVTAAAFTFESTLSSTLSATGASFGPIVADVGTGSMTVVRSSAGAVFTSPDGNGSARSLSSTFWKPGSGQYLFAVPTTGLTNIQISFDMTSNVDGPKDFGVAIASNGTSFTTVAGYEPTFLSSPGFVASSGNTAYHYSFDFSAQTSINNASAATFRLQDLDGNSFGLTSGSNQIDNIIVTGVPEPAMLGLAVTAVGGLVRRRSRV